MNRRGSHLGTRFHLADKVLHADVRDSQQQGFGFLGIFKDPGLDFGKGLATSSLDHIREQRPRCSAKSDKRNLSVQGLSRGGDRLEHVSELLIHIYINLEPLDIVRIDKWGGKMRAGVHDDFQTHCLRHDEDVTEYDRGVHEPRIPSDWLQGDLACEGWVAAYFKEFVLLADFTKLYEATGYSDGDL
jgi:hypothetical protein